MAAELNYQQLGISDEKKEKNEGYDYLVQRANETVKLCTKLCEFE